MIRIDFFTKNWSLIKSVEIESQYIPKVGELIDAGILLELPKDEVHNFFVSKVIYEIDKKKIIPIITCFQWLQGHRQMELEMRGWLPNTTGHLIHDDQ